MVDARQELEAVARRLRGALVDTPLIGGLLLPGHTVPAGLRIKPEGLQPGGAIWFRGAMHALARRLGATKGVVAHGETRRVLATVVACAAQRVPVVAVVADACTATERALMHAAGAERVDEAPGAGEAARRAAVIRQQRGYAPMPAIGDADHDLGLATVGLELARDLSSDADVVLVSPAVLEAPLRHGLAAGGRALRVVGVDVDPGRASDIARLRTALCDGVRLACDPAGLAALDAALGGAHGAHPCVVLSC